MNIVVGKQYFLNNGKLNYHLSVMVMFNCHFVDLQAAEHEMMC